MNVCQSRHDRLENDLRFFRLLGGHFIRKDTFEISIPYFNNRRRLGNGFKRIDAGLRQRGDRAANQIVSPYLLPARMPAGKKAADAEEV